MEAYLDNSATTKCAAEVVETAVKVMSEDYGNPSSKHSSVDTVVFRRITVHDDIGRHIL